ncbi:MAG: tetratricopeptide repeat protein, partial [Phycisphaerales bacterium]|nr:tetratricopeptide repeat protein [Phycisphaerales bacterium]
LEKALALGPPPPGDPQLHFQAGTVASKAGRLDRAEEHYSMAQQGNPSEAKYPLYLAMIQLKSEPPQTDAAAASLLRAIRLNPDLAEAYGTLGQIYLQQNKLGIALRNVQRATALQPTVARWRVVEAKVLKRQGQPELAATVLQGLDAAQRRSPEIMGVLAECYGMMKKPGLAAAMYAEAYEGSGSKGAAEAGLAYEAAVWHERAGDETGAIKYAKAAAGFGHAEAAGLVARLGK